MNDLSQISDYLFACAGTLSIAAENIAETEHFNGRQKVEMIMYLNKIVKVLHNQGIEADKLHEHVSKYC